MPAAALTADDAGSRFVARDGTSVTIRPIRRGDLDPLLKFANVVSKEKRVNRELGIVSLDGRTTRAKEREFLNRILAGAKRREVVSRVAMVGGEIIGHCDVWRRKLRDVRHTGVLGIVVRDGYRDLGIGERLVTEVLRESEKMDVWLVELTVFASNGRALHLYEKLGFKRVGVIPHKVVREARQFDEVIMYADLRTIDKSSSARRGRS